MTKKCSAHAHKRTKQAAALRKSITNINLPLLSNPSSSTTLASFKLGRSLAPRFHVVADAWYDTAAARCGGAGRGKQQHQLQHRYLMKAKMALKGQVYDGLVQGGHSGFDGGSYDGRDLCRIVRLNANKQWV